MFCLYHFSLKWIIKKNYLLPYGHLKQIDNESAPLGTILYDAIQIQY